MYFDNECLSAKVHTSTDKAEVTYIKNSQKLSEIDLIRTFEPTTKVDKCDEAFLFALEDTSICSTQGSQLSLDFEAIDSSPLLVHLCTVYIWSAMNSEAFVDFETAAKVEVVIEVANCNLRSEKLDLPKLSFGNDTVLTYEMSGIREPHPACELTWVYSIQVIRGDASSVTFSGKNFIFAEDADYTILVRATAGAYIQQSTLEVLSSVNSASDQEDESLDSKTSSKVTTTDRLSSEEEIYHSKLMARFGFKNEKERTEAPRLEITQISNRGVVSLRFSETVLLPSNFTF